MKRIIAAFLGMGLLLTSVSCQAFAGPMGTEEEAEDYKMLREIIAAEFSGEKPHEWGDAVSGVKTHLQTEEKVVALGIETCGADSGQGEDIKLLKSLEADNVPATVFLCGDWLDRHENLVKKLAANPLFEMANQGLSYKPCSVNGKSVADRAGTRSVGEVFTEIEKNARRIETLTGLLPQYYRAGRGYYDEVAVRIVNALGYEAIGATIQFPEGAELTRVKVLESMMNPASGAIAIFNPGVLSQAVREGVLESVRRLRSKGYRFVKLSDYPLQ